MSNDTDTTATAMTTAERIAKGLEAEYKAATDLLAFPAAAFDLDPDGLSEVNGLRKVLGLEPLAAGSDNFRDEGVQEWLESKRESVLEFVRHGRNSGWGWMVDYVAVVLSTGGPRIEVRYWGCDKAEVVVTEWFDKGSSRFPVDQYAVDYLFGIDDLLDAWDG